MKKFQIPEMEVVLFDQKDVITTSTCPCVECNVCPTGKDNCTEYDQL